VPFIKIKRSRSPEVIEQIRALRPDLIIVVSWSQIIPKEVLDCAPLGCVGIHYSLLPARRGGAPLNWALIDGLTESGITLFYYDEGIDTGDIIGQRAFPITRDDTVKTLLDKIIRLAPDLLAEYLPRIKDGTAPRIKQREEEATYTKRRRPEDSEIPWDRLSDEGLYNFIRALVPPYPSAFTYLGNRKLTFTAARLVDGKLRVEGTIEPRGDAAGRPAGGS
jgi:methionyl-tRNA formyltransferase